MGYCCTTAGMVFDYWNLWDFIGVLFANECVIFHRRRYGEAVQELSICAALAPSVERHMLEHFVEKLHLLRIESSWSSVRPPSAPSTLA